MLTLLEIKAKVDQLADKIGASQDILPTYGVFSRLGCAQIDVDAWNYHYLLDEGGETRDSFMTKDIDELLCKIFIHVTFELSQMYELSQRVNGQYCREILFQHQLDLLSRLSSTWAERLSQQHELTPPPSPEKRSNPGSYSETTVKNIRNA